MKRFDYEIKRRLMSSPNFQNCKFYCFGHFF